MEAIKSLAFCAQQLISGKIFSAEQFSTTEEHMSYWMPLLNGLAKLINHRNLEIRSMALNTLFEILNYKETSKFSQKFWAAIFGAVLFPIFQYITIVDGIDTDDNDWIAATCLPAFNYLSELFTKNFALISFLLPDMLDLSATTILQSNENLSRIGSNCFLQLILKTGNQFDEEMWDTVTNFLHDIFDEVTTNRKFLTTSKRIIIPTEPTIKKSVSAHSIPSEKQLAERRILIEKVVSESNNILTLLISVLQTISTTYFDKFSISQFKKILLTFQLVDSPPSNYGLMLILFRLYLSKDPSKIEISEEPLIIKSIYIIKEFLKNENESVIPLVLQILYNIQEFDSVQLLKHLPAFYGSFAELIISNNLDIRQQLKKLFVIIGNLQFFEKKKTKKREQRVITNYQKKRI